MPGGLPTSIKVEIEMPVLTAAPVFVDVTDYVDIINGIKVTQGRASEFEDVQSGTLALSLLNDTGRFTPDNPSSDYFPGIVEGARVRFTVVDGATTSVRFFGRIASWEPHFDDGETNKSTVDVFAVDIFAELARRTFKCDFIERWTATARSGKVDLWPFDEGAQTPTTFRNAIAGTTGSVVLAKNNVGSIAMESPSGVVLDGSLVLSRNNSDLGPVVSLPVTSVPSGSVNDIVIPFRTADTYGTTERWVAHGTDSVGTILWSLRLINNAGQTDLNLYDASGAFIDTLYFQFAPPGGAGDDQWYALRLTYSAFGGGAIVGLMRVSDQTYLYNNTPGTAISAWDFRLTRYIVLGGKNATRKAGKQTNCVNARFGAVGVSVLTAGHMGYLQPNAIESGQTRVQDLFSYSNLYFRTIVGTSNYRVTLKQLSGRTALECFNELARTMGGVVYADYSTTTDRAIKFKDADQMRKTAVALTVDAEADLDASNGLPLRRATEGKPTRVTATWPSGSVTLIGDESQQRLDDTVDTCAADETGARAVASAWLNRSVSTRVTGLRVSLVTAQNDLYAATLALSLGDRIRLSNLPAAKVGFSRFDSYLQGWTETWSQDDVVFDFDPSPADAPVEGVFDDAEYGRFSADGNLKIAFNVSSGATTAPIVPTSASAAVLTTDAAAYPLDLEILGERVTVSSVPSTSTRTNRITNPSFETNTTGWTSPAGYTAATLATSAALTGIVGNQAGGQSLLVSWPTAASGGSAVAFSATGLTIGQVYVFSIWAFVPGPLFGGVTTTSPGVTICETAGAGTGVTYGVQTLSTQDKWVRLDMTLTASATTHSFGVKTTGATTLASAHRVYLDAALLEQTTNGLGTFFDGATGGTWTGTAHGSTTTQTIQTVTITRGVAPTLAVGHTYGENVDVWHAAAFAF